MQNLHLERHGHAARVDPRSLQAQGIDRQPEKHIGASWVKAMPVQDVAALLARRVAEGELARARQQVGLIDLSGDLAAAKAERASQQAEQARQKEAALAFARQATAQFKAEQAARDFARQAAEQFKAEIAAQAQAEQARQQATARELARQKQEAEAKREAEIARQSPKKGRDQGGPGWSR